MKHLLPQIDFVLPRTTVKKVNMKKVKKIKGAKQCNDETGGSHFEIVGDHSCNGIVTTCSPTGCEMTVLAMF